MTAAIAFNRYLARYPYAAVAAYAVLVAALLVTIWVALASLVDQRAGLADSLDILNQLEARQQNPNAANNQAGTVPSGCLLYTSPSPRDGLLSRMPSSA